MRNFFRFDFVSSACGNYHTALIRRDGRLFLFGTNESRQCGRSIPSSHVGPIEVSLPGRVKSVACGHEHTLVLTEEGKVYVTGKMKHFSYGFDRVVILSKDLEIGVN